MQAHEWSNGDISPEITFTADDGRKFGKKFSMNLKVNTAPALEYAEIGKTTVSGEDYYVLIFRVKDMDTPITAGSLHKDLNGGKLIVTSGGVPSEIPLSLNAGKTDFATGGDLLAASTVNSLDSSTLPGGSWLLRLKTNVKVGGPETEYSVSIKDSQGLSSAVIQAKTKKNKLSDVELFEGLTPIPDPADITLAGATAGNPKVFAGMSGKTLTAKAAPAGAGITGSISRFSSAPDNWTQTDTVSGTTSAVINLPALAAGEDEALYKISLKAQLTGYDDSDSKDFFVSLVRQELPVLKIKQDFSSSGQSFQKNISAETAGYVSEDIIPNAGNYNTATKPLVIYNLNGRAAFVIAPRTGSGATVMYKLNADPEHSATTEAPIRLPNAPATHTLQVWAVKNGVEGPKTTLHIKVIKAITAYSELKNVVQNAPAGNEIQINIGGNLTASSGDTEIAVSGGKNLKLIPSLGGIYTIDADGNGRIFKVSGVGTELNLEDIKLEGGYDADETGGAVHVETGGILKLTGKTVITPSTGGEINKKGKNDVYLATDTSIKVDSNLTGSGTIARITVADSQYHPTTQVLTASAGVTLAEETYKFAVTPKIVGGTPQPWTVGGNGCLKEGRYTEVPYNQLGTYLANASATEVNYIEVTGTIPEGDLNGSPPSPPSPPNPGPLGQNIKSIYPKEVALKLPSSPSVNNMKYCFASCTNLISVENIPSGVTNMEGCFYQCLKLTQAPVIPSTVKNMKYCFNACRSLTQAPDIPSGVNNMRGCFYDCRSLTTTPFIPATVTDMQYCFANCIALTTVSNISSGVTNMAFCFEGCKNLTTVPNIPSGVTSMAYCFNGCTGLTTAPNINEGVTDMRHCFRNCTSLTQGPDIPATVTHMRECFKGCTGLQRVKLNCNYNSDNFNSAFSNCTSLPDGGIKVPSLQLAIYKANAGTMGTTKEKFSAQ